MRGQWNGKLAEESVQWVQFCTRFTTLLSQKTAKPKGKALDLQAPSTNNHEGWVMTETMRLKTQAAEMGFLRRVAGVSPRDKVKSEVICDGLRAERTQLRWFRHLVWMPPRHLPRELFQVRPAEGRHQGRPSSRWIYYILTLA